MRRAAGLLLLLLGFAPARASAACNDSVVLRAKGLDTSAPPLIKIYVDEVDSEGRFCADRAPRDFALQIDSEEVVTAVDGKPFVERGEPIYVAVVAPRSGTSDEILDGERRGVRAIAESAARIPRSRVIVPLHLVDLDGAREPVVTFVPDEKGSLADQVYAAIDLLNEPSVPTNARKLIVVLSDGSDESVHLGWRMRDLGARASIFDTVIDTVELGPKESPWLSELSRISNGLARRPRSPAEVAPQLEQIAVEVTRQYVLIFQSTTDLDDGREHELQLIELRGALTHEANALTHHVVRCSFDGTRWRWCTPRYRLRALFALYGIIPITLLILALRSRRRLR